MNFQYLYSFFIFIKNRKQDTVRFLLFILMKKLKNELLKQIKINFMIIIKYSLHVIQEPVRVEPPEVFRCAIAAWTPKTRCLKTADLF